MKKENIQKIILNFFKDRNQKIKKIDLEDDFFSNGYIDSLGAIELVAFIEEEFQIELTSDEMENPDFKIVNGLINIIYKKCKKIK
tara:strand:- start:37259 stop:37513 length:255 start_codon:yes stop_codon:yes gene_type:complete